MSARFAALVGMLLLAAYPGAQALAAPTVTEFTAGVTPGFSASSLPVGIASGPDGNLWVAAEGNPGYVFRITPAGVFTEFTGGVTPGFTADGGPEGIVAGPDGNLWFTEYKSPGRVARITTAGDVTEFTAGFSTNGDQEFITAGPDGNLWFTMLDNPGAVVRVTPSGAATQFTGGVTPGFPVDSLPAGITAGPDGNLWFAGIRNPGRIVRITPAGEVTVMATGGVTPGFTANARPLGITTGPDGALWFAEATAPGGIGRITSDGTVSEFRGGVTPGFNPDVVPRDIVVGPDGNLWFTSEPNPGHVVRVTPGGVFTEFAGGTTPGMSAAGKPQRLAAGPDGNLWFTEPGAPGRIARMTVGPRVTTGAASGIGTGGADLNGSVRPNGQTTIYRFEYGTSTAYGSQTPDAPLAAGVSDLPSSARIDGLQPGTLYHYRLVATNDSATTLGDDATFTTAAPSPVQAALSNLRINPSAFPAAGRGPSARSTGRRAGARVTFRLNVAASVRFTVQRQAAGRRVRGRCVAPSRRNRGARGCVRHVSVRGSFRRTGQAGANAFRFTGRMAGSKLRAGRYRLVASPSTAGPSGGASRAAFRIVR